jgi:hypothetical protein
LHVLAIVHPLRALALLRTVSCVSSKSPSDARFHLTDRDVRAISPVTGIRVHPMWLKAKRGRLAFAVLGLALAGCGGNGKTTALPRTVTDPGVQSEAVVYIYFCTADTCAKEATQAQINAVSRRASDSPLVEKVVFISKEEALAILRRKYPEEVKALPSNPFPDRLTVVPKHQEDVKQVAALFSADPAYGIDRINYSR